MPGPRTSESLYANLKQQPPPTTPATSTFRSCGNLPRPKNSPQGCFCPAVRWTRGPGFSIPTRVTFYARHLLKSAYKEKSTTSNEVVLFGDPYGNRTSIILQISFNAIRTNDNFITGMDFIKGYFYICVVQSVVLFI